MTTMVDSEPPSTYAAMTMTSGRPGMTRKTLLMRESASSARPPRKPPPMPMTMEMAVAMRAAAKPMTRVPRAETMSCSKTSWPTWVVPSQCSPLGDWSRSSLLRLGSSTSQGPMRAVRPRTARMTRPAARRRERSAARSHVRPAPRVVAAWEAAPGEVVGVVRELMARPHPCRVRGSTKP
jgi:hypothetical protein